MVSKLVEHTHANGLALVAYTDDDRIVTVATNHHTDKIIPYGEAVPEAIGLDQMLLLGQPVIFITTTTKTTTTKRKERKEKK